MLNVFLISSPCWTGFLWLCLWAAAADKAGGQSSPTRESAKADSGKSNSVREQGAHSSQCAGLGTLGCGVITDLLANDQHLPDWAALLSQLPGCCFPTHFVINLAPWPPDHKYGIHNIPKEPEKEILTVLVWQYQINSEIANDTFPKDKNGSYLWNKTGWCSFIFVVFYCSRSTLQ